MLQKTKYGMAALMTALVFLPLLATAEPDPKLYLSPLEDVQGFVWQNNLDCQGQVLVTGGCSTTTTACKEPVIGLWVCATAKATTMLYHKGWCPGMDPALHCYKMSEDGGGQSIVAGGSGGARVEGHSVRTCTWNGVFSHDCRVGVSSMWMGHTPNRQECFTVGTRAWLDINAGVKPFTEATAGCWG